MPQNPFSVLLIDGESPFAVATAHCLRTAGRFELHVLAHRASAPVRHSRLCRSFRRIEDTDEGRLRAIRDALDRVQPDLIAAIDWHGIQFLSQRRGEIEPLRALISVPDPDALETALDKGRFARFLRESGLPHPPTWVGDEPEAGRDPLPFPLLAKPRRGANGEGIRRLDDRAALLRFCGSRDAREFVFQSRITGWDIGMSVLCRDGEIMASTIQADLTAHEAQYTASHGVYFLDHPETRQIVARLCRVLRWNGLAHIDLRVDGVTGEVFLLELNPRCWGSLLASLAAGVNFPALACQQALGIPFTPPPQREVRFTIKHRLGGFPGRRIAAGIPPFRFSESPWRYTLADPLPSVAYLLQRNLGPRR